MSGRIARLDHVQLAMPAGREDDARAFYTGVLGMRELPKPEALRGRGGCWFEPGVHLGVEDDFRPARKAHPALVFDDFDTLCAALLAAGHPVTPDTNIPGTRRCYTDDPFGNRLELIDGALPPQGPEPHLAVQKQNS